MTDDELKALVVSNARSIQALTEAIETSRLQAEEDRQRADLERRELRETMQQLARTVNGVVNLTVSLDSDRPTVLRKLDSIESGVDSVKRHLGAE